MEYWTPKHPCDGCGATSNTSHPPECHNYGMFDAEGNAIPATPAVQHYTMDRASCPTCNPPKPKEPPRMQDLDIRPYTRKPFNIDAVQVTAENMEAVARWCSGSIRNKPVQGNPAGRDYIKVRVFRPMDESQTEAFIGSWVLYAGSGYKVYTNKAFQNTFVPVVDDSQPQLDLN